MKYAQEDCCAQARTPANLQDLFKAYFMKCIKIHNPRQGSPLLALVAAPFFALLATTAHSATLAIVNPGFETDTPGTSGATAVLGASGWTITTAGTVGSGGAGDWFTTTTGLTDSTIDPDSAAEGNNWLSANRLAGGSTSSSDPAKIVQLIDISGDSALVDLGNATVSLDFMFSDSDPADDGYVNITFYSDLAGTISIGSSLTTGIIAQSAASGTLVAPWAARNLSGAVPALARSLMIEIVNDRTSGSAGNTHYDAFSGAIAIPEPSAALLGIFGFLGLLRRRR
jgi:hypothetical protein